MEPPGVKPSKTLLLEHVFWEFIPTQRDIPGQKCPLHQKPSPLISKEDSQFRNPEGYSTQIPVSHFCGQAESDTTWNPTEQEADCPLLLVTVYITS